MNVDMLTHGMTQLMNTLQTLGVGPLDANRFAASVIRHDLPTVMEVFGRGSITGAANGRRRNLNIQGLDALDLRTQKANGEPWDFDKAADRQEAREDVLNKKPSWLIGSPPCVAFCIFNQWLNKAKMAPEKYEAMMAKGRRHLHFMISLYVIQLEGGRHFLHEHPQSASSWKDMYMQALLKHPRVVTSVAHTCRYVRVVHSKDGQVALAKKPTRFATTAKHMAARLN